VARLQERARWSSFTNMWNGSAAQAGAPRWVRRMIIVAFVVMALVGLVVGIIGILGGSW
jgi:TRAP-type mannitol/chloroaromatic compound transport system permease small subunit